MNKVVSISQQVILKNYEFNVEMDLKEWLEEYFDEQGGRIYPLLVELFKYFNKPLDLVDGVYEIIRAEM